MKHHHLLRRLLLLSALTSLALHGAPAPSPAPAAPASAGTDTAGNAGSVATVDGDTSTIRFSDPSKPGTLKLAVANGDIRISGTDGAEVQVRSEAKPESTAPRPDGLRVLTSGSSYSLVEKNNVVTLSYGTMGWSNHGGDFEITVPRNTNVVISNSLGGDIEVRDISGNLEIKSLNGEVKLADISGGALIETMNGEIDVDVRQLAEGRPLSCTSMNGEVRINLPVDTKANVKLRTHNGSILTDFDDKQLSTKTTTLGGVHYSGTSGEIRAAVRDAVRVGMEAAREATQAAREAIREAHQNGNVDVDVEVPEVPVPPMAPLPPMTGGKLVTGTLNGGGTDIQVSTMNGNITLRKAAPKKS